MRAVAGLKLSAGNYTEAIDTLKKIRKQAANHLPTYGHLESVASATNIKALRRLYDQVEFQVRSLKSLEVPLNSYGYLLSSLFVNWLPQELRLIISREIGDAEWCIDEIMTIVEREISARERAFASFSSETHGTVLLTAALLLTNDHQSKCAYCRQSHSSSSCTTIIDVSQWKAILKRTGRCYVCLKRHHLSRDCHLAVKCGCCNGRHHMSICKDSNSIQSSRNSGNSTHHSTRSQSNAAIGQGMSANIQQPANLQALQSPVHSLQ